MPTFAFRAPPRGSGRFEEETDARRYWIRDAAQTGPPDAAQADCAEASRAVLHGQRSLCKGERLAFYPYAGIGVFGQLSEYLLRRVLRQRVSMFRIARTKHGVEIRPILRYGESATPPHVASDASRGAREIKDEAERVGR
jgi:hypothetical protein